MSITSFFPSGASEANKLDPVTGLTAMALSSAVKLLWTDPEDLSLEPSGQPYSIWDHTRVIRKAGSIPKSPNDGVLVVNSSVRNQYQSNPYTDSGLEPGVTYYYAAYAFNTDGVMSDGAFSEGVIPLSLKIVGVKIDTTNSNPETSVSYIDDAQYHDTGYEAWKDEWPFNVIKPCVVKDGAVRYYLNPDDFSKQENGEPATINDPDFGDVMIEFPKMGYKINKIGTDLYVRVTNLPEESGYCYKPFSLETEGDCDKIYIASYLCKLNALENTVYSVSGIDANSEGGPGNYRKAATQKGAGYQNLCFYDATLLQCLFLIVYKNLDSQTALGYGQYRHTNSKDHTTGTLDKKGMCYGEPLSEVTYDKSNPVKFLGIENLWGTRALYLEGMRWRRARADSLSAGFKDFDLNPNKNFPYLTNNYRLMGPIGPGKYGFEGWVSDVVGTNDAGFMPLTLEGSSSTYYKDHVEGKETSSPDAVWTAYIGAEYLGGDTAGSGGLFAMCLSVSDYPSFADKALRLTYKHKGV